MTISVDQLLALAAAEKAGESRQSHDALNAARWLEEQGLKETHQVGDLGAPKLHKGHLVEVLD